jgi:hypothetical protein
VSGISGEVCSRYRAKAELRYVSPRPLSSPSSGCTEGIQKSEKALAESLSPSATVEAGTVESGAVEPDLEAGLDSKK